MKTLWAIPVVMVMSMSASADNHPPRFEQYYACLAMMQGIHDEEKGGIGVWNEEINDRYEHAKNLFPQHERDLGDEIFVEGLGQFRHLSKEFVEQMARNCIDVFKRAEK